MASVSAKQIIQKSITNAEEHQKAITQVMETCRLRGVEVRLVLEMHGYTDKTSASEAVKWLQGAANQKRNEI